MHDHAEGEEIVTCPQCKTDNHPETLKCSCGYQFRPVGDRSPLPLKPEAVELEASSSHTGFFSFQTFISPLVIKMIYLLGVMGIVTASITVGMMPAEHLLPDVPLSPRVKSILLSVLIFLIGNLVWRMVCEMWMVFFSMRTTLALIARRLKKGR
jgi:hypothetical protein